MICFAFAADFCGVIKVLQTVLYAFLAFPVASQDEIYVVKMTT